MDNLYKTQEIAPAQIFAVVNSLREEGSIKGSLDSELAMDIAFYVKEVVKTERIAEARLRSLVLTSLKLGIFTLNS